MEEMLTVLLGYSPARSAMEPPDDDLLSRGQLAAERIRELRKGVALNRPDGVSLRDYAHLGHRY